MKLWSALPDIIPNINKRCQKNMYFYKQDVLGFKIATKIANKWVELDFAIIF